MEAGHEASGFRRERRLTTRTLPQAVGVCEPRASREMNVEGRRADDVVLALRPKAGRLLSTTASAGSRAYVSRPIRTPPTSALDPGAGIDRVADNGIGDVPSSTSRTIAPAAAPDALSRPVRVLAGEAGNAVLEGEGGA